MNTWIREISIILFRTYWAPILFGGIGLYLLRNYLGGIGRVFGGFIWLVLTMALWMGITRIVTRIIFAIYDLPTSIQWTIRIFVACLAAGVAGKFASIYFL